MFRRPPGAVAHQSTPGGPAFPIAMVRHGVRRQRFPTALRAQPCGGRVTSASPFIERASMPLANAHQVTPIIAYHASS